MGLGFDGPNFRGGALSQRSGSWGGPMGPSLHKILDYRHFAIGDAKTQAFRVALGDGAALGYYHYVFATGIACRLHPGPQQSGLQSASAVGAERARTAEGEDLVFGNDQAGAAGDWLVIDGCDERKSVFHLVQRSNESAKRLRGPFGEECILHDASGYFGFFQR